MDNSGEGPDGDLSEIYDVLKTDAKVIVNDLRGGVTMWREAAGADIAAAGFLLILALTEVHYDVVSGLEGTALLAGQLVLAAVLAGLGVFGLGRYAKLRRRYKGLFARAEKLE